MKFLIAALFVFSTAQAFARVDGLSCEMKYSSNEILSTSTNSAGGWLTLGQTLASNAVKAEKDGMWGTLPAHYLKVGSEKVDGKNFWKLTIRDADSKIVGTFSFAEDETLEQGMSVTIPVNAFDQGDEDPTNFNILTVTCQNTVFVG